MRGVAVSGETVRLDRRHLARLERVRAALGARATGARLLLFGSTFAAELAADADRRDDVELVGLERLYRGV